MLSPRCGRADSCKIGVPPQHVMTDKAASYPKPWERLGIAGSFVGSGAGDEAGSTASQRALR